MKNNNIDCKNCKNPISNCNDCGEKLCYQINQNTCKVSGHYNFDNACYCIKCFKNKIN